MDSNCDIEEITGQEGGLAPLGTPHPVCAAVRIDRNYDI
jgi:hypothetical protein